jgi:hypothetical protein
MEHIFKAKIRDFQVRIEDQIRWLTLMQEQNETDIEITITKYNPSRSVSQNRLYRVYLGLISDYTGDDENELHEMLKNKFLKGKSTTQLDTKGFADYLEKIRRYSAEVNITLPLEGQIELN